MPPVSALMGVMNVKVVGAAFPAQVRKSTGESPVVSGVGCDVPRSAKVAVNFPVSRSRMAS